MGESSGALLRQMGYARPTLTPNCGSYAEIPDWAAVKIEPGMDESALLKAHLAALIENPDFRESLGKEASSYVRSECDIGKGVRSYAGAAKKSWRRKPGTRSIFSRRTRTASRRSRLSPIENCRALLLYFTRESSVPCCVPIRRQSLLGRSGSTGSSSGCIWRIYW